MYGTNLETSQVMLLSDVMSVLAAVLAVERDDVKGRDFAFLTPPKRAPLCGLTNYTNRTQYIICIHRAVKTLQIAGLGWFASRELVEQELKIKNLTPFSFLSLSPAGAATITISW